MTVPWLAVLGLAWAQEADPSSHSGLLQDSAWKSRDLAPEPYATAVTLVERLFLDPSRIDGPRMLEAAAEELADQLDWLRFEVDGSAIELFHGDGTPLGRIEVHGTNDLPAALAELEDLVAGSGYALDGVDVELAVLSGMAEALDRYSRVLADERLDRFEVRLTGTQLGIGAGFEWDHDRLVVTQLSDGGPGALGGLLLGDEILRIDGRSTVSMPLTEAHARVRGESGTQVTLTVRRDGVTRAVALTRAEVIVPNVTHEVLPGDVGYVWIDHVSQRTVENLRAAMDALREAGALDNGLIIDLRGNTGGSMKESAKVADLFLTEGLLLRTVGKDGGEVERLQAEMYATDDGTEPDVPLVVVVDERTASGSEILAGALLELDRAALIGTRTYGKGTVQKIYPLRPDMRLKLTVARYILANDRAISGIEPGGEGDGILPDVVVGRVDVEAGDVRFTGWDDGLDRADWERIVPEVHIGRSDPDLPVEIARRAVLQTTGSRRASVLGSLVREAEIARLEQTQRLQEVLAGRSIDWSPAPADGGSPDAEVQLTAAHGAGSSWTLTATVVNRSAEPVHRALVELSCDTASWWDGVVVPVGRLAPGQSVTRAVQVELPLAVEPRADEVQVRVRADRRPVREVGAAVLESGSTARPTLRVEARLVSQPGLAGPHGQPVHRAELTIENLSRTPVPGLEARFGFPAHDAIELLDAEARFPELAGRTRETVNLSMELGPGAPKVLPLELVISSTRFGELARWPVALPVSGETVDLQAPSIEVRQATRSAPAGPFALPIVVGDDRKVDHLVVDVNGHKVSWEAGGSGRLDTEVYFDLQPGHNRIVVRAEDDQGISGYRVVSVRGEPAPDAVDAGE